MLSWPMMLMHGPAKCAGIVGTIWPLQNTYKYLYLKYNLEWCARQSLDNHYLAGNSLLAGITAGNLPEIAGL